MRTLWLVRPGARVPPLRGVKFCGQIAPLENERRRNKKRSPSKKGIKNNAMLEGAPVNFRRNDFDVTNRINTTDPVCVKLEVARIHRSLYHVDSAALNGAFDDLVRLYYGRYPGYTRCDTQYH